MPAKPKAKRSAKRGGWVMRLSTPLTMRRATPSSRWVPSHSSSGDDQTSRCPSWAGNF
jgi:hypothetical protein